MFKKIFHVSIFFLIGIGVSLYFTNFKTAIPFFTKTSVNKQVIGFLPYWTLDRAAIDYSPAITTLTYFSLNVDGKGHIVKLATPQQEAPGWYALHSGELNPFLTKATQNHITLSLLIASGDSDAINQMISNPVVHANNLIADIAPLMRRYHFSDINLDIESTPTASDTARQNFTTFVKTIQQQAMEKKLGTVTLEIASTDIIRHNLINLQTVAPYTDHIVLMAYDYHSQISQVTGPVAPLYGAGIDSEYDVATAVEKILQVIPPDKLILGMPLYGYTWETLNASARSAIIPGSGVLASNTRMESFKTSCATCGASFDSEAQEEFVVYKDQDTQTFYQTFFPNQQSVQAKISYANQKDLGGVALWALGYESNSLLKPLSDYITR